MTSSFSIAVFGESPNYKVKSSEECKKQNKLHRIIISPFMFFRRLLELNVAKHNDILTFVY